MAGMLIPVSSWLIISEAQAQFEKTSDVKTPACFCYKIEMLYTKNQVFMAKRLFEKINLYYNILKHHQRVEGEKRLLSRKT